MNRKLLAGIGLCVFVTGSAAAQRGAKAITTATEVHQDAKISPDGGFVAFRGPGKLGLVSSAGGVESAIVTSLNIGSFVWSPSSSGLYYLDNTDLRFVSRTGQSNLIASLPGSRQRIYVVDSGDLVIWGRRFDATSASYRIFRIATNGAGGVKDVITNVLELTDVRLDVSESKLVYTAFQSIPFAPREIFSANVDGTGITSLSGGTLNSTPQMVDWVDPGQSVVFSMVSQSSFVPHIARIGPVGTSVVMLTEGRAARRNSAVFPDKSWLACEAQHANGVGPAILPVDGGGIVPLTQSDNNVYAFSGPPTIDAAGRTIVFAASVNGQTSQVYAVALDRELHIFPRVETAMPFTVELPISQSEVGVVLLSGALLPAPFPLPGYIYGLAVDLSAFFTIASGTSASGMLSTTIPVPNDPTLIGQSLYFQGVRARGLTQGDFTRYAEIRIF